MEEPLTAPVFRLANELKRRLAEELAGEGWVRDAGFRPPCMGVLRVVAERGPVSQREISDDLAMDPSDLVAMLDLLEEAGYIERRRDPADRRRNAVVVTPGGKKAAARLRELSGRVEEQTLARLDPSERRQLVGLIGRALGD